MGARRTLLWALGLAAGCQVVLCNYWPGFPSPNERPRAYQALAVVHRGDLSIGPELLRFGEVEDVATFRGREYPNKAPGLLPLVVPAAWVAHVLRHHDPAGELFLTLMLGRLLTSGIPFLLTGWLIARLARPAGEDNAVRAAVIFLVASPALVAASLMFSHSLTGFLLLAAFALLLGRRPASAGALLGGAALGWAAVAEYTAVIPGLAIAVAAVTRLRWRSLAAAVGGLVPLSLLAAYNQLCFRNPLSLSAAHESSRSFSALVSTGLFGIGTPTVSGVLGLLASPARGLLVWLPVASVAVVGWVRPNRDAGRERWALAAAPLALLVVMSGYPNWHGGWFAGPRYLFPVLPLLFVAVAQGLATVVRWPAGRIVVAAMSLWSIVWAWSALATFPFPPEDYPFPPVTVAWPLLREGVLAPSWLPHAAEAVILGLAAASAALIVLRAVGVGARSALAAVLVAGLSLVSLAPASPPPTFVAQLEWAVMQDVYLGITSDALERLRPGALSAEQRERLRYWIARRQAVNARR